MDNLYKVKDHVSIVLKNVKDPFGVREIIYHQVEMAKKNKGMQYTEYASAAGHRG